MFDPVCGMNLSQLPDLSEIVHNEKSLFFCSKFCVGRFSQNPKKFLKEPLVKLRNVRKVFKLGAVDIEVLRGLDLNIWEGDFAAIIGASGSGKSTALNMIGLLDRPTGGQIFIKGKDVSLLKEEDRAQSRSAIFGFIFQQYNLIPWLNAYENASLPLIFAGRKMEKDRLNALFQDVGLKERMTHVPSRLSGGEQQRVALLRALANDPQIILGDEPTGNLDSDTGNKLLEMLLNLNKTYQKTLIIVTHDADIAKKADQVIVLKDGQVARNHEFYAKIYTE